MKRAVPSDVHKMIAELTPDEIDNVLAARTTDDFVMFARAVIESWRRNRLATERLKGTAEALHQLFLPTPERRREE